MVRFETLKSCKTLKGTPAVQFYSEKASFNNTFANIKIILPGYSLVYTRLQPAVVTDSLSMRGTFIKAAGWPRRMYQGGGGGRGGGGGSSLWVEPETLH